MDPLILSADGRNVVFETRDACERPCHQKDLLHRHLSPLCEVRESAKDEWYRSVVQKCFVPVLRLRTGLRLAARVDRSSTRIDEKPPVEQDLVIVPSTDFELEDGNRERQEDRIANYEAALLGGRGRELRDNCAHVRLPALLNHPIRPRCGIAHGPCRPETLVSEQLVHAGVLEHCLYPGELPDVAFDAIIDERERAVDLVRLPGR
jgi:hypothetical protein